MSLPKNKGPFLYKSYAYGEVSRNVCTVRPRLVNDQAFTSGYIMTGSVKDRREKPNDKAILTQSTVDNFVKGINVRKGLMDVDKHMNYSKKIMVKMGELSDQLASVPKGIVDGLDSIQKTIQEGLTSLSFLTMDSVVSELPGSVELRAWVKPIEQLSAEATQQVSIIQGMIAQARLEETSLSKVFAILRDKLSQGIQALIGFVNKCEAKIIECVNFLRAKTKVLSGKWSQLLEVMPKFSRLLSRMSDGIGIFFKAIMKKLPFIGNAIDLWGASEASEGYLENPHNKEAKRKYVVAILGFIVGVIMTIAGVIFTFCVAAPAAVVAVPIAILAAGYAALSIYYGEDPIARGFYSLCPETMTEVMEKVESILVWIGAVLPSMDEWIEKGQEYFDKLVLGIRDVAKNVGELKDEFVNSPTGQRLGDFLLDNLP